jgi:shikimate dehydrogenase
VSRQGDLTYLKLEAKKIQNSQLIINTTPLGMHPNVNDAPAIDYSHIGSGHFLFDLVYNPTTTLFMQKGLEKGAKVKNGLEMLHLQAEKAWEIWNS